MKGGTTMTRTPGFTAEASLSKARMEDRGVTSPPNVNRVVPQVWCERYWPDIMICCEYIEGEINCFEIAGHTNF
jgi:hypothetical protein